MYNLQRIYMKTLRIKKQYFDQIASRVKRLEARLAYPDIKAISIGQQIKFECGYNYLIRNIIAIRYYESIEEMLNAEPLDLLLPGYSKINAKNAYDFIYPPEKIIQYGGIIVFELS